MSGHIEVAPPAARAFLHIGLPKTGTTYLQDTLWANRDALRQRGLLIPGANRRRHLLASLDVREDERLADRPGDTREPWAELVREGRAFDGDVLISHEFFGPASPEQVRRIVDDLEDREVHVVVTCRAMVELGISRWQEWVKNGGRKAIDRYPPRDTYSPQDAWGWGSFDLADVLARWGQVLPHGRIHVLPMAPGRSDPEDLWLRFLSVLAVDPGGLEVPERPVNETLGLVETELLRRVNQHLGAFRSASDRGNWIRGYLGTARVLGEGKEKFRPGPEKLADLERRGRAAEAMLQDEGYDVVGELGLLEPRDLEGLRHPSEVSDGELLAAATRAIAVLLEDVRTLSAKSAKKQSRGPRRVTVKSLLHGVQSKLRGDN